MDYTKIFAITAAGMAVQRTRVEVAANNIANANTTVSSTEPSATPLRAVIKSVSARADISGASGVSSSTFAGFVDASLPQVSVESSKRPPRLIHEPGHPLANTEGFIAQPAVDLPTEMITMMTAARTYEANIAVASLTRNLALKTLEIGG